MKEKNPPLYLITGVVIGLLVGLLISYVILPVRYTNTAPETLSEGQKAAFRGLVARAYLYEADPGRAAARLALLNEAGAAEELVAQAQQMVADGSGDDSTARGLALLASALTNPEAVITPISFVTPGDTPTATTAVTKTTKVTRTPLTPTATPFATYTPRPSATAKPTQGSPFVLVSDPKEICDPEIENPLLMIYVYDASGKGISGVKLLVSVTNGGQSEFYTGFFPKINNGYADYEMVEGHTYSLSVGESGEAVSGLSVPECVMDDGSVYPGSLELKFKQQ